MGSNSGEKKDFFGRPVAERFPHYPFGVIIPRCGPGPPCVSNRSKKYPRRSTTGMSGSSNCLESSVPCQSRDIRPRANKTPLNSTGQPPRPVNSAGKKKNTDELCTKIAAIVAREIPEIDERFLHEIQTKCKLYWDCLVKYNVHLNEEAVFEELTQKIREWVQNNSLHERRRSQTNSSVSNGVNHMEFLDNEEDLEELYGTALKFSGYSFANNSGQIEEDGESEQILIE